MDSLPSQRILIPKHMIWFKFPQRILHSLQWGLWVNTLIVGIKYQHIGIHLNLCPVHSRTFLFFFTLKHYTNSCSIVVVRLFILQIILFPILKTSCPFHLTVGCAALCTISEKDKTVCGSPGTGSC